MNSTSADYQRFQSQVRNSLRRSRPSIDKAIGLRSVEEGQILEAKSSACPTEALDDYRVHFSDIDHLRLKELVSGNFYNGEVLKSMACAVDATFYTMPREVGQVSPGERAKQVIRNFRQIGVESANGYALSADMGNAKDMFIAKVARDPDDAEDLRHEMFVGLMGTNRMREDVPNFAYVLGGFKCSPPSIDPETKKIVNWCSTSDNPSGGNVPYVVYENITPAKSIGSLMEDGSPEAFLSSYLQILFALVLANRKIDFTHYDLHTENVLMRDISSVQSGLFQIPYIMPNGSTYYIMADSVATIIDFGNSFIRYKDQPYGIPFSDFMQYAIFPDRSWYLHDAYKLLLFCMRSARQSNNRGILEEGNRIFRFFNKSETLDEVIDVQWPHRYTLPYLAETAKYTIWDLITHIFQVCDCDPIVSNRPHRGYPILECRGCQDFRTISHELGVDSSLPRPKSILQFYDLSYYLKERNELHLVAKDFPYERATRDHVKQLKQLIENYNSYQDSARNLNLKGFNVLTYQAMVMVRSSYNIIFRMVDLLESIDIYIKAGLSVSEDFKRDKDVHMYQGIWEEVNKSRAVLCEVMENATQNYAIISNYLRSANWDRAVNRDRRLLWYATNAGEILNLQNRSCRSKLLPQPATSEQRPSLPYTTSPVSRRRGIKIEPLISQSTTIVDENTRLTRSSPKQTSQLPLNSLYTSSPPRSLI